MKADLRRTRRYLPLRDGGATRADVAAPRAVVVRQPVTQADAGRIDEREVRREVRWSGYKPVTAAFVALSMTVVAVVALRTKSNYAARATGELAPLTTATELRTTGDRALALVNYPWHDLGYEIVFAPGQAGVRAQTDVVAHRITVFLAEGDAAHRVAHDIGHELGHAYDARYLSQADRDAFVAARGKPNANWFPGKKFSDYDTGAGDFAEVFASCHAASPEFRSRLAPKPLQPCSLIPLPRAAGR